MTQDLSVVNDVYVRLDRKNRIAVRHGLPDIGSRITNNYGIDWVVDGHLFAPDLASYVRDVRDGTILQEEDPRDLLPSVVPQNISPRLQDFLDETDRLTSKHLMFLDTVPCLRPRQAKNDVHYVSFTKDPDRYLYYLDIANVDEAILAHETAHLWVDLLEGREDYRVMHDRFAPDEIYQSQFVNSFVSDLWVNDVIRARGFDTSRLEWQEKEAILKYAEGVAKGASRNRKREDAFWALPLASLFIQRDRDFVKGDSALAAAMRLLETCRSDVYALATRMAATVEKYGYTGHEPFEAARIECLQHSFDFTGDIFDPDVDLVHKKVLQPDIDKWPEFFSGLPVAAKLEIRRAMVKHGTDKIAQMSLICSPTEHADIEFIDAAGNCTQALALKTPMHLPGYYSPERDLHPLGGHVPFDPHFQISHGMQRPRTPQFGGRRPLGPQVPPIHDLRPPQMPQPPQAIQMAFVPQPPVVPQLPSLLPEMPKLQLPSTAFNVVRPDSFPAPPSWAVGGAFDDINRNYMPGLALSLATERLSEVGNDDFGVGNDNWNESDLEVNLYRYVGNDPVGYVDPSGLKRVGNGRPASYPVYGPPVQKGYPPSYPVYGPPKRYGRDCFLRKSKPFIEGGESLYQACYWANKACKTSYRCPPPTQYYYPPAWKRCFDALGMVFWGESHEHWRQRHPFWGTTGVRG